MIKLHDSLFYQHGTFVVIFTVQFTFNGQFKRKLRKLQTVLLIFLAIVLQSVLSHCFIHYHPHKEWYSILIAGTGLLSSKCLCSPVLPGTSGQTPQLFHSQPVGSTTTALPGNTPLYPATTPLTPMTPITPATPASESSGIVPQLQ